MPIYEYRCLDCGRRSSHFTRSMSATVAVACPRCGGERLERLLSRVVVRRGSSRAPASADDGAGDWGGEGGDGGEGDDGMDDPFGLGEDADPRELARWTRAMSQQLGEPLDADLDRTLADIERGADPEEALEALEEREAASPTPDDPI